MKERPIPFSGPMVRAILDGRKTQTRRVIPWEIAANIDPPRGEDDVRAGYPFIENEYGESVSVANLSRYGQPGDRLWVRETWRPIHSQEGTGMYDGTVCEMIEYRASEGSKLDCKIIRACSGLFVAPGYTFTKNAPSGFFKVFEGAGWWSTRTGGEGLWRPSIHMPRWASRLTLEIEEIRVERLQEISEEDALAEGIEWTTDGPLHAHVLMDGYWHNTETAKEAFAYLWDSINAKRGYSWGANPWVWVIKFHRLEMKS